MYIAFYMLIACRNATFNFALATRKVKQMNIQLHRKQIVILGLALILAVASYWIPAPQKPSSISVLLETPKVESQSAPLNLPPSVSSPLPTAQFLIVEPLPQQPPLHENVAPKINTQPAAQHLPSKSSFLNARDLVNSKTVRIGDILLVPIKNFDLPQKP